MKKTNKLIKMLILMIIAINFISLFCAGSVQAVFSIDHADLYSKGDAGDLLKYNGQLLYSTMVFYKNKGSEYPAYCVQSYLPGVMENGPYTVSVDSAISNTMVWRAIINGYPYKTPQELGCSNVAEAFTATKQAVYCMLYGNDANNFAGYEAVGEAGTRTLNALKKIVGAAKSSSEVPGSSQITINEVNGQFKVDNINKNFISKEYKISSVSTNGKYTVTIEGNYPKGTLITDKNNNIKKDFDKGENFKILIPINTTKAGSFTVKVTGNLMTKPVLYGKAPHSNWQDYALAAGFYELGEGTKTINTPSNTTKITIKKIDGENNKPLEGVIFQILDENKKIVRSNIITDKEGNAIVDELVPGNYYLQEIATKEGYTPLKGLRNFTLEYNQDLKISVYNYKEKETVIEENNANINMGDSSEKITISNKNDNTNIFNNDQEINISNNNSSTNINNNSSNSNVNNNNQNQNVNNNNQNQNINNSNQNQNINNNNNNANLNNTNNNTNVNNNNQNVNINNNNQNTNILNNNSANFTGKLPKTGM